MQNHVLKHSGIHPFNPGIMLASRGINLSSKLDPEKEKRKTETQLFITSTELTKESFLNKLQDYEKNQPAKQNLTKKLMLLPFIKSF